MRLAVAGTGRMATVRTTSLMKNPEVILCAVASRRLENAQVFAATFGAQAVCTDRYEQLAESSPDAVLVEVPHRIQDEVVLWALEANLHVLVGGCLASSSSTGERVSSIANDRRLIVETGYEARYKDVWKSADQLVRSGDIGEILLIQTTALIGQDTQSWYYDQHLSGGMVPTHMTYAFLNPMRWMFGTPLSLTAISNKKHNVLDSAVDNETCVAAITFPGNVICSMVAGYRKPEQLDAWSVRLLGSQGSIELSPGDDTAGHLDHYPQHGPPRRLAFETNTAFDNQADAFLAAIAGAPGGLMNPPHDSLLDMQLSDQIVQSAAQGGALITTHFEQGVKFE